jgi:hypothetical protein
VSPLHRDPRKICGKESKCVTRMSSSILGDKQIPHLLSAAKAGYIDTDDGNSRRCFGSRICIKKIQCVI